MLHNNNKLVSLLIVIGFAGLAWGQQAADNCTLQATKPEPKVHKYALHNCLVAQFAGYLTITPVAKYLPIEDGTVDETQSSCGNATQKPELVVNFKCGNIHMVFNRNATGQTYVESISGSYVNLNGTTVFSNNTPAFNTSAAGHYYKCDAEQTITFQTATLTLKNVGLEAYRNASGTDFYQIPDECLMDSQPVSNVVRIGVGVCLLALVAIVIIAYFVGRRRWVERSTYQSV